MEFALQHNFLMAEMAKLPPRFFRPTRSCNYSGVVCINVFFFFEEKLFSHQGKLETGQLFCLGLFITVEPFKFSD
jgi:hypothetical protein